MQQLLRDKFTKKSKDFDEDDYNTKRMERKLDRYNVDGFFGNSDFVEKKFAFCNFSFNAMNAFKFFFFHPGIRKILEAKLRMSDSQYSRLLETLATPSDYAYAQTMMDEIIYQLAKLMFNQGLFIG